MALWLLWHGDRFKMKGWQQLKLMDECQLIPKLRFNLTGFLAKLCHVPVSEKAWEPSKGDWQQKEMAKVAMAMVHIAIAIAMSNGYGSHCYDYCYGYDSHCYNYCYGYGSLYYCYGYCAHCVAIFNLTSDTAGDDQQRCPNSHGKDNLRNCWQ